jgi:hypothetical protein
VTKAGNAALVGLALAGAAGCASAPVATKSQFDQRANFAGYRSYMRDDTRGIRSAVVKTHLEAAVDRQLEGKGLVRKEQGGDLWVVLRPRLQREYREDPRDLPWNAGFGYGGSSSGSTMAFAKEIPVGTLVVEIVDTTNGRLVWRGTATSELDSEDAAEKNLKLLDDAMRLMFKDFPPKK